MLIWHRIKTMLSRFVKRKTNGGTENIRINNQYVGDFEWLIRSIKTVFVNLMQIL